MRLDLPPFSLTRCFIQILLHKKQRILPLLNKIKGGCAIALYATYFKLLLCWSAAVRSIHFYI